MWCFTINLKYPSTWEFPYDIEKVRPRFQPLDGIAFHLEATNDKKFSNYSYCLDFDAHGTEDEIIDPCIIYKHWPEL